MRTLLVLTLLPLLACQQGAPSENLTTRRKPLIGPVDGHVPAGLPSRLLVGLFEDTGKTWMKDSGVPWDVRYRYFIKGWINNYGWGPADGSWALEVMQESAAQGFIPAIQYYQMNYEPGGGEESFLSKAQNATTMRSYFSDFKVLMERTKEIGQPVLILLEADGYGFLQRQSNNQPNTYAAVADTGLPELAGLPDTVAGWGLAFLQLRKAVGAHNAILGIHVSGWASGKDIAHGALTEELQPEVTKVHDFLSPLGLGPNVTGDTYDVLVGDPLDRDADFYVLDRGEDRWWDPSDSASIYSKSFNRYAEWLRLWNLTSGKRWVLWQIPLGNSNHLNVPNTDAAPREGYRDNRTEYFFGRDGLRHLEKFASSGVIALLFGRGEPSQSSYTNDYYTDGELFMKSRAGNFLKGGGLAIPSSPTTEPTSPPNAQLPSFTSTVELSDTVVPAGGTVTLTATVTATGGPLSEAVVDIEIHDTAGTRVGQQAFDNQAFFYGQSSTYSYEWTVPASGTYTVKVGVFDKTWATTYSWNDAAAALQGSAPTPTDDGAFYNFENGLQGWTYSGGILTGASASTAQAWAGNQSLALTVEGTISGSGNVYVLSPPVSAGSTLTFHVWLPAGSGLSAVQPYVQEGSGGGWRWTSSWYSSSALVPGAWNTLLVQVPPDAVLPLHQLGLQLFTDAAWSGPLYIDSVSW
ncbi:MAG TPA: hypothetical protein VLQ93_16585 [Myxococcaceae bacterium]|nr:hypothetical protein [Myxococcaceae bacterium]